MKGEACYKLLVVDPAVERGRPAVTWMPVVAARDEAHVREKVAFLWPERTVLAIELIHDAGSDHT